jgi:uncharacterized peroxidase-related enzyme
MTWIQTVDGADATAELKSLYDGLNEQMGFVPNIMAASSLKPNILKALVELVNAVMFGESGLSRTEKETIALVVSSANRCTY